MVQSILRFGEVEKSGLPGYGNLLGCFLLYEPSKIFFFLSGLRTRRSIYVLQSSRWQKCIDGGHYAFWQSPKLGLAGFWKNGFSWKFLGLAPFDLSMWFSYSIFSSLVVLWSSIDGKTYRVHKQASVAVWSCFVPNVVKKIASLEESLKICSHNGWIRDGA